MTNPVQLKTFLLLLIMSIALSGCSPERRAVLRLTALNFKIQASDAIESVKTIYQLNPLPRSTVELRRKLLKRLLSDRNIDFADIDQISNIIENQLQTNNKSNPVNNVLNDLKQEYIVAGETFNNIEQAGLLGTEAGAVTRAAEPSRRLTVKMLLLAELVAQNSPSPKNPDRVVILFRFSKLRTQFQNAASEADKRQIFNQGEQLLDELLSINIEDKTMICQARAKLLLTAETGAKLSQLIEKYNDVSFDEVVAKITTILGIASSFGSDITAVNVRLKEIQTAIQEDPILNDMLNKQRQNLLPATSDSQPLECSS
ncbi:hypothetical protein [Nostoc sp. LEGE 12450]|uniref:hypothetical protein n=1 Tax=Nostoc sp. LEGE 12450 TaxID=1828643 RepID=UPI001882B68F|nr:hypothetical protein [Nostoc sp. LEGE 12450]MBE8987261.1 hypothetical protein [Nostoc sp. LEGE 12450]